MAQLPLDAIVNHDAVADDAGHKVAGSSSPLAMSGDTTVSYAENGEGSVANYNVPGPDTAVTWSLSGDDSDDFSISSEGLLSFKSPPNYEDPTDADTDNQYRVTIQVSDGTNTSTRQVTVLVTNVWLDADELPVISGTARVGETLTADTSRISATFSLGPWYWWVRSDGTTDTDIEGATASSYTLTDADVGKTIKVRVNFYSGINFVSLTSEATEAVSPERNTPPTGAPTISSVAITSDPDENDADLGAYIVGRSGGSIVQSSNWASGVYRIGDDVEVTVMFSEDVTVTGSPQLELAIGSSNRTAVYESAEGSAVVFSYTVAEGDSDDDGIAINANKLALNGGSIKDAANNDADLSHNALAAQDGHKVDGIRPRLSSLGSLDFLSSTGGNDGAYTTGEELLVKVELTEDGVRGSVTGPPQVSMNFDGGTRVAKWDPSLHTDQYRDLGYFTYVVQEGDLDSDGPTISANSIDLNGGFIRDAAGNDAVLTHSAVAASSRFIVDAVAPTVSSIAITSDPGMTTPTGPATGSKSP